MKALKELYLIKTKKLLYIVQVVLGVQVPIGGLDVWGIGMFGICMGDWRITSGYKCAGEKMLIIVNVGSRK